MMRPLPVAWRANFSADSTASVPLLQKKTRSRPGALASSRCAEQARDRLAVELGPRGEVHVERVVQRLLDHRVGAPGGEHPEPGQEVRVGVAVGVVEVGALAADVVLVEADGVQRAGQLRVQVLAVQVVPLAAHGREFGAEIKAHCRIVLPGGRASPTIVSAACASRRGLVRYPAPQHMCMVASTSGTRARTPAGWSPANTRRDRGDPGEVGERGRRTREPGRERARPAPAGRPDDPGAPEDQAGGVERGRDRRRQVAGVDRLRVAARDDPPPAPVAEVLLRQGRAGWPAGR